MNSEPRQEQERVDSVLETITELISKWEDETVRRRKEVVDIRKHFWDEIKKTIIVLSKKY